MHAYILIVPNILKMAVVAYIQWRWESGVLGSCFLLFLLLTRYFVSKLPPTSFFHACMHLFKIQKWNELYFCLIQNLVDKYFIVVIKMENFKVLHIYNYQNHSIHTYD